MADDTTLTGSKALLCSHNSVVLIIAAYFVLALVKNQEIVDQIQEPSFIEHSKQARVQLVWDRITNLLRFKSAHLLVMKKSLRIKDLQKCTGYFGELSPV